MKRATDLQLLYFKIFNFFQPPQTNYSIKIKVRHRGLYLRTPTAFDSKNSSLPKFWGPGIFGSLVILLFFRCHQKDLKLWSVVSGPFCNVLSAYNAWFLDELPIHECSVKYQSLLGGWTNPFEKYATLKLGYSSPRIRGENSKNIWVATS